MKVVIVKKTEKEGESNGRKYHIRSLYVKIKDEQLYNKIVAHLQKIGVETEKIEKFIKPNEYNGEVSYAFFLNCSLFTFNKVSRFSELDCNILFEKNDKGFANAKIQVIDKVEQINGYVESDFKEPEVTRWAMPEEKKTEVVQETEVLPIEGIPF